MNRGDTISEGKKLATLEQTKGNAKPTPPEDAVPEETLSNKERFLRSSFRSKEELLAMRDRSAGFQTDLDSIPKPHLTKQASAPHSMTLSKTDDDLPQKKEDSFKSKPRVRTLSERSERPAEVATGVGKSQLSIVEGPEQAEDEHQTHSEPAEAPSHLDDDEVDHYAAMQEQSALPEEDAGSSSDEDSGQLILPYSEVSLTEFPPFPKTTNLGRYRGGRGPDGEPLGFRDLDGPSL